MQSLAHINVLNFFAAQPHVYLDVTRCYDVVLFSTKSCAICCMRQDGGVVSGRPASIRHGIDVRRRMDAMQTLARCWLDTRQTERSPRSARQRGDGPRADLEDRRTTTLHSPRIDRVGILCHGAVDESCIHRA